LIKAMKKK